MYFDYENSLFERVSTFLFSYMQSFSSIEFQTQKSLIYSAMTLAQRTPFTKILHANLGQSGLISTVQGVEI